MNREFAIAMQYVQVNYRELYQCAEVIVLTPRSMFPVGQTGQCSHDNFVSIADGNRTVGEYVDTLVHELKHAQQNKRGVRMTEQQREEEAYEAGIQAANDYIHRATPWAK